MIHLLITSSASGLHDMKIISKAGTMIRLVSKIYSFSNSISGQSDENSPHFQDGSSFRWAAEPPLHIARGLEGAWDHHAGRQHHHAHLLQSPLCFWTGWANCRILVSYLSKHLKKLISIFFSLECYEWYGIIGSHALTDWLIKTIAEMPPNSNNQCVRLHGCSPTRT